MNRLTALFLTIPLAMPLAAAAPAKKWTFGVHGGTPSLTGHFMEKSGDTGAYLTNFDLEKDLALGSDGTGAGLYASYLGSRFGLSLDYIASDYSGDNRITREMEFAGHTFTANGNIVSSLKTSIVDVTGTVKLLRPGNAWLGVDLGVQMWSIDADATGNVAAGDIVSRETYSESYSVPVPQVGVSGGLTAFGDRLEARGRVSFISYSGASYTRFGVDARFYVLPWLGVRAFFDSQSLDAPDGSIIDKIEAKLDRSVFGFGVAARF